MVATFFSDVRKLFTNPKKYYKTYIFMIFIIGFDLWFLYLTVNRVNQPFPLMYLWMINGVNLIDLLARYKKTAAPYLVGVDEDMQGHANRVEDHNYSLSLALTCGFGLVVALTGTILALLG